jgi:hypothetical protein
MRLDPIMVQAMMEELSKIAAISAPSIKAPPTPGGDGSTLQPKPASPVTPRAITSKALGATNLQKTNYTAVGTKVPAQDLSQAWSKSIPAPVVRS